MEAAALLSWLAKSPPLREGEVSLGKRLLQLRLALALALALTQAQADRAGEAIALPEERHLAPAVCREVEPPETGSVGRRAGTRDAAGRDHGPCSAGGRGALAGRCPLHLHARASCACRLPDGGRLLFPDAAASVPFSTDPYCPAHGHRMTTELHSEL